MATIFELLLAILADGVMRSVTTSRRSYLREMNGYFAQRGVTTRRTVHRSAESL